MDMQIVTKRYIHKHCVKKRWRLRGNNNCTPKISRICPFLPIRVLGSAQGDGMYTDSDHLCCMTAKLYLFRGYSVRTDQTMRVFIFCEIVFVRMRVRVLSVSVSAIVECEC